VQAELKTRQADLAALEEQRAQYNTLGRENLSVVSAETSLTILIGLSQKRDRLEYVTSAVAHALATLDMLSDTTPPEPPSLEKLDGLVVQCERLRGLAASLNSAKLRLQMDQQEEKNRISAEAACRKELDDYVSQWGVCPTCGQSVQK
jgi:hypothetical protein